MTNDHKNRSTGGFALTRRQLGQAAVAGGALAAFGRAPAFAQNTTLKVGVLLPRSGLLAQAGQACQRGAEIAPAVLADLGYKVEVMSADTELNVDVARSRTEKLINDGANVIVGAFDSGQTAAAAQVCEQRGVPLVMNIAAADRLTEQGFKTVFRNFPTSTMLVTNGLALMKDLFAATGTTPKTAVFLHANDTFGMANRQALDTLFPTLNMPFTLVDFDLLRPQGAGSGGRGGEGQGDRRRTRHRHHAGQRRHHAGARDGQAAVGAQGHRLPRFARPV